MDWGGGRRWSLADVAQVSRAAEQSSSFRTVAEVRWLDVVEDVEGDDPRPAACCKPGCGEPIEGRGRFRVCRKHKNWRPVYSGQMALLRNDGGYNGGSMAKAQPKDEPEITLYTIKREGQNFRMVTAIIRGEKVLAVDESDIDARMAQLGRVELALRRIP